MTRLVAWTLILVGTATTISVVFLASAIFGTIEHPPFEEGMFVATYSGDVADLVYDADRGCIGVETPDDYAELCGEGEKEVSVDAGNFTLKFVEGGPGSIEGPDESCDREFIFRVDDGDASWCHTS